MEDKIYTLPGTTIANNTPLFPDCDYTCISNYNYIILNTQSSTPTSSKNIIIKFFFNDGSTDCNSALYQNFINHISFSNYSVIKLPDISKFANCSNSPLSIFSGTSDFTGEVILTSSLPGTTNSDSYDKIANNILLIPATMLVIYLFYCIYRMLLKGRS